MSRIDELIAELCPEGVEFKPLKDAARIRNGKDYKGLGEGSTPVYGTKTPGRSLVVGSEVANRLS